MTFVGGITINRWIFLTVLCMNSEINKGTMIWKALPCHNAVMSSWVRYPQVTPWYVMYLRDCIPAADRDDLKRYLCRQVCHYRWKSEGSNSHEKYAGGLQISHNLQVNLSKPHEAYIDGLVQGCSISSALALEIMQSCTKPLICICGMGHHEFRYWLVTWLVPIYYLNHYWHIVHCTGTNFRTIWLKI